jgi:hypothetical protein
MKVIIVRDADGDILIVFGGPYAEVLADRYSSIDADAAEWETHKVIETWDDV